MKFFLLKNWLRCSAAVFSKGNFWEFQPFQIDSKEFRGEHPTGWTIVRSMKRVNKAANIKNHSSAFANM